MTITPSSDPLSFGVVSVRCHRVGGMHKFVGQQAGGRGYSRPHGGVAGTAAGGGRPPAARTLGPAARSPVRAAQASRVGRRRCRATARR